MYRNATPRRLLALFAPLALLFGLAACGDEDALPSTVDGDVPAELPTHLEFPVPGKYAEIPPEEREARCVMGDETCVIDGKLHFVRGDLELPVRDGGEPLLLTVWLSVAPEKYERMMQLWHSTMRMEEPPYFAWLNDGVAAFPPHVPLKANLNWPEPGKRPLVALQPTAHPLSVAQREGLSRESADRVARIMTGVAAK